MKFFWIITLLSATLATSALAANKPQHAEPLDRVVAVVNNTVITASELDLHTKAAKQQLLATRKPLPSATALRQQVLDRLIFDTLQIQIAQRNNIEISNEELNEAIQKMAGESRMSVAEMKKAIERDGIDYETFRKRINDQMVISRLQQSALSSKVHVTDTEVSDYLNSNANKKLGSSEYHLFDILVPLPEDPTTAQIQTTAERAKKLVTTLKNGADFAQTATNSSSGTEALGGGDLGWRKAAELPTLFANQLSNLKVGDITDPIRAPNGFHILKLVDVHNDLAKLNKNQIKNLIYHRKFDEHLQTWLQQLRDSAYVKITL